MPRPMLPKAEEVAGIAKVLRAEGFQSICIETSPDGRVSITIGELESFAKAGPVSKPPTRAVADNRPVIFLPNFNIIFSPYDYHTVGPLTHHSR